MRIMIIIIIIIIIIISFLKCAMSGAALPGGMLGAYRSPRPLPLSLVGWCVSCNNNKSETDVCYTTIVVPSAIHLSTASFAT